MFIPLHDKNSLKHIKLQYVTFSLIAVNVLTWLLTGFLAPQSVTEAATVGSATFRRWRSTMPICRRIWPWCLKIPPTSPMRSCTSISGISPATCCFSGCSATMSRTRWAMSAFSSSICSAPPPAHFPWSPLSLVEAPLVGASGAISGVVAAYIMLHPKVRVWVLVLFRFPLPLPAFIPLLFWVGQQFYMLLTDTDGVVSWGAHVGGIISGAILVLILRRRGVPLFDTTIVTPKAVRHADAAPDATASVEPGTRKPPPRWGRG